VSADVDERTLREIYLLGFERVVTQARPWTVMCAYNKVNSVYASENHWLLTESLRGDSQSTEPFSEAVFSEVRKRRTRNSLREGCT
jgi:beta-glucosidase-like glycosyl hydrolase